MPGNLLQAIGLTPEWFQSVMGGVAHGTDQPDAAPAPQPQAAPQTGLSPEWFAQTMGNDMPNAQPQAQQPAGQPENLLEGLNYAPVPAQAQQAAPAPAAAPRQRRSLLSTVGSIADVLAKVGGAEALYQPTLDAREDRTLALGDHARAVDLDALKMAASRQALVSGQGEIDDHSRAVLGQAFRGLQAIQASGGDVNKAWPVLAQRMGIPPEQASKIGEQLAQDPSSIVGFSAALNDPKAQGTQPKEIQVYNMLAARDPKMAATYLQSIANPDAMTPKQVADLAIAQANLGINQQELGLKRADTASQIAERTAKMNNPTPAQQKAAAAREEALASRDNALTLLDNVEAGFNDLHKLGALPGDPGNVFSQVTGAVGRTGIGQMIGEQAGSPSAQKRVEIMKNISALQQAMLKSLPASATRTKFEQEMLARGLPDPSKMSYGTAQTVIRQLRQSFQRALASPPPAPAASSAPARKLPPRIGAPASAPAPRRQTAPPGYGSRTTRPPAGGGWGKATVVK